MRTARLIRKIRPYTNGYPPTAPSYPYGTSPFDGLSSRQLPVFELSVFELSIGGLSERDGVSERDRVSQRVSAR